MLALLSAELDLVLRRGEHQPRVDRGERLVRHAERILEERFATSVSLPEVAAALGVSVSTLRSWFVRLRGQPPSRYLRDVRLRRALHLIRSSDLTLDVVARSCGFDSASHLSRTVREVTGRSPGSHRA